MASKQVSMYHVARKHTGNNQSKQQVSKIKIEKGIKDYNPRKKPTLINTSKIEINEEIGIKYYITLEKPILSITKKWKKK